MIFFRRPNHSPSKLRCGLPPPFPSFSLCLHLLTRWLSPSASSIGLIPRCSNLSLLVTTCSVQLLRRILMVCPWPFMANLDSTVNKLVDSTVGPSVSRKSFAEALSGNDSGDTFSPLPISKIVMGNSVRVKISQAAYESGLASCRFNLHGRLSLHNGDSPLTTQAPKSKLNILWPRLNNWYLIPLGKGFFELKFSSIEDM